MSSRLPQSDRPSACTAGTRRLHVRIRHIGRIGRAVAASRWTRFAFLAVALAAGGAAIVPHRHAITAAAADVGLAAVLAAAVAAVVGLLATMQVWRAILAGLGSVVPLGAAAKIFFVGQLGKYLPGSVWPIVAQMELAHAHHVPRHRTGTAALLTMIVSLGAGLLTAAVTLPLALAGTDRRYLWLLGAVPLVALALHPAVLNALLTTGLRVTRRPRPEQPLRGRTVMAAVGWAIGSWLLFGVHVWLLLLPLMTGRPGTAAAVSAGGFAFAWCVGFLLVVAPAGAGARDLVLVALLATQTGAAGAAAVALLSRAVMTGADVVLAGAAAAAGRSHGRTSQHSSRRGSVPVGRRTS
ncbi:lysylphosphatidylglycerol synthase domain-containing protein [Dactylosporangium sp. NPDC049525]|uniref:lysylphosphatidylglycerol synthase domain-containing protein n=1 Tax=Dactylosporangium sp. NPDC049525 TaxID=3154730 RepID=UPI003443721E